MEETVTKKLRGAIFGFKNGTKTAADVQLWLNKLKEINPPMAEDFEKKYIDAARERSAKQLQQAA